MLVFTFEFRFFLKENIITFFTKLSTFTVGIKNHI